MIEVIFQYDEATRKWDPVVKGVVDKIEARQAFSAVVLTCQELDSDLLILTLVSDDYKITPAV